MPTKYRDVKAPSPLMMALASDRTDIAEMLIELGASAAFKNKVCVRVCVCGGLHCLFVCLPCSEAGLLCILHALKE